MGKRGVIVNGQARRTVAARRVVDARRAKVAARRGIPLARATARAHADRASDGGGMARAIGGHVARTEARGALITSGASVAKSIAVVVIRRRARRAHRGRRVSSKARAAAGSAIAGRVAGMVEAVRLGRAQRLAHGASVAGVAAGAVVGRVEAGRAGGTKSRRGPPIPADAIASRESVAGYALPATAAVQQLVTLEGATRITIVAIGTTVTQAPCQREGARVASRTTELIAAAARACGCPTRR